MPEPMRKADSKGRLTLGKRFANRPVIVETIDETAVRVTLARIVPECEAWLHTNPVARDRVAKGLEQAAVGRFSETPPDIEADEALANQLED